MSSLTLVYVPKHIQIHKEINNKIKIRVFFFFKKATYNCLIVATVQWCVFNGRSLGV